MTAYARFNLEDVVDLTSVEAFTSQIGTVQYVKPVWDVAHPKYSTKHSNTAESVARLLSSSVYDGSKTEFAGFLIYSERKSQRSLTWITFKIVPKGYSLSFPVAHLKENFPKMDLSPSRTYLIEGWGLLSDVAAGLNVEVKQQTVAGRFKPSLDFVVEDFFVGEKFEFSAKKLLSEYGYKSLMGNPQFRDNVARPIQVVMRYVGQALVDNGFAFVGDR